MRIHVACLLQYHVTIYYSLSSFLSVAWASVESFRALEGITFAHTRRYYCPASTSSSKQSHVCQFIVGLVHETRQDIKPSAHVGTLEKKRVLTDTSQYAELRISKQVLRVVLGVGYLR